MKNILETPSGMNAIDLIESIRNETRPIKGHSDPGALDDCFDELQDWAKALTIEPEPEMKSGEEMRNLGRAISELLGGLGFALFVFEFNKPGLANYISNAQREDMLTALRETLDRLEGGQTFPTPEKN